MLPSDPGHPSLALAAKSGRRHVLASDPMTSPVAGAAPGNREICALVVWVLQRDQLRLLMKDRENVDGDVTNPGGALIARSESTGRSRKKDHRLPPINTIGAVRSPGSQAKLKSDVPEAR